jgi:hypothetical protein
MPYHLVAYRDTGGILASPISLYRAASLDTAKHGYLSRMAATAIPLCFILSGVIASVLGRIEELGSQDNI